MLRAILMVSVPVASRFNSGATQPSVAAAVVSDAVSLPPQAAPMSDPTATSPTTSNFLLERMFSP
ncbi:MAG: hypothetical protein ACK55I_42200, partial [bacterium]